MKTALQVMSWISVVLGVFALLGGIASISADPQNAYYSLVGGTLFGAEGALALAYISSKEK